MRWNGFAHLTDPFGQSENVSRLFFFETGHLEWRHLVERFGSCYLVGVRCWFDVSEPGDRSFSARYLIGKPITVNTPPRSSHSFSSSFLFLVLFLDFRSPFSFLGLAYGFERAIITRMCSFCFVFFLVAYIRLCWWCSSPPGQNGI